MADAKLTSLTTASTVSPTDILYGVSDPSGTPASKAFAVGSLSGPLSVSSYSTDETITVTRNAKIIMTGNTTRNYTLSSVDGDDDLTIMYFENASPVAMMNIMLPDSDLFSWGAASVECITVTPGSAVTIQYVNSTTKWYILSSNGRIFAGCLDLYISGIEGAVNTSLLDDSGQKLFAAIGSQRASTLISGRKPPYIWIAQNTDYLNALEDWGGEYFDDTTDNLTVALWLKNTTFTQGYEANIITYYNSSTSYWRLGINASNQYVFEMYNTGEVFALTSTTTAYPGSWQHIAVVKKADAIGLYIDGTQESYDTGSSTPTLSAGTIQVSKDSTVNAGDAYGVEAGMSDICIARSNIFAADPNSTPDDTITITADSFLNLVK